MTYKDQSIIQSIEVREDPRIADQISKADYEAQLELGLEIREAINEVHASIAEIQSVKKQISWLQDQTDNEEVNTLGKDLIKELTSFEEQLMQTKNKSNQDPIRFAPRLDNQLIETYNYVTGPDGYISGGREGKPNKAAYDRWGDLDEEWTDLKKEVEAVIDNSVEKFNEMVKSKNLLGVKRKQSRS